ncbi:nibrin [Trichonephila clavipes]|nr:nibrin [Trichonephila clavipes]
MTGHIYRDAILEQHVRLFHGCLSLWMTTPVLTIETVPLIGGYPPYGLASILTGLESIEHVWDMQIDCSPSTPSHLSTGTTEGIA